MLVLYRTSPLSIATEASLLDVGVGDSVETTFPVANKDILDLANVVQFGTNIAFRFNAGFDIDIPGSEYTLAAAPASAVNVIAPGTIRVQYRAYRQAVVTGVTDPNINEQIFYLADIDQIGVQKYQAAVDEVGIMVSIDNFNIVDPEVAQPEWLQLAPMQGDGTAGTYEAAGDPLALGDIFAVSEVDVASLALDTTLTVDDGTDFAEGQLIMINITGVTAEVVRVVSVLGDVLTTEPMQYAHAIGETVFHCGWGVYGKATLPTDDEDANNWHNVSHGLKFDTVMRD